MKFRRAALAAMVVGMVAYVLLVPTHRWLTVPTLICLTGGIALRKDGGFRKAVEKDRAFFLQALFASCAVGLVAGVMAGRSKWWILVSMAVSIAGTCVGYFLQEVCERPQGLERRSVA